jgi:Lsr2
VPPDRALDNSPRGGRRSRTHMAQKVTVSLIDDLDGGPAVETVNFALDRRQYEIDLSDGNAAKLRETMANYVAAGRPTGSSTSKRSGTRRARTPSFSPNPDNQAIRDWARTRGIEVSDRGRIAEDVRAKYYAEHGAPAG